MNTEEINEMMSYIEQIQRLTKERDLLLEQKHYLSENLNRSIEQIQKEKQTYDDAVRTIEVLKRQISTEQEEKYRYKARVNILLEENDLLKHILSINNIQLTTEVVQDAQRHLRGLTKEMIE